jgi:coenzyme F420-reducing hydrogenase delta subunit
MGKYLISSKLLGNNTLTVINQITNNLIFELGLDGELINKELLNAKTKERFKEIINKHFKEHIILQL